MFLESRIDDKTTLIIDAESVGGIDKGALSVYGHPDKVIGRAVEIIRTVASQFGIAAEGAVGMSEMDIAFAVRVDSNSTVALSRKPEEGQFRVTLRWRR